MIALYVKFQVIVALNQTLVLHEKIRRGEADMTYSTKELIYHYNCGDLREILFAQKLVGVQNSSLSSNTYEMEQARRLDDYMREELIYKRNERMAKRVLKLIEEEPKKTFFFAFGAGNRTFSLIYHDHKHIFHSYAIAIAFAFAIAISLIVIRITIPSSSTFPFPFCYYQYLLILPHHVRDHC